MIEAQKSPLTVVIPPPIWALLFMLVGWGSGAVLGLAAIKGLRQPMAAIVVIVLGLALAVWGRATFGALGTEIRPASPTNKLVVTSGPFRFTRNPMYLGLLLVVLGVALWIGTLTAIAAVVVYFLWVNFISIPFEEAKMARQHGDTYRAYKAKVRRWI